MTAAVWTGDACGLVDAYRAKEVSPVEILDASIEAIESSQLNAVCHLDPEGARAAASSVDLDLPFAGVPFGVKELDKVAGWPWTHASLVFADQVADEDLTAVRRLRASGAVLLAQTTASEFGGVNCTSTRLHGTTRNPWDLARTPGGSSGGSAAAVAGGLLPIATGSDGGGSIRIPAGFCGLLGLKTTFGRIPKGPWAEVEPLTAVLGCLSRSVRDTARYLDALNGYDLHDPLSLPRVEGYEAGLGSFPLEGRRVTIVPDLGMARVRHEVAEIVVQAGEALARETGLRVVDVDPGLPPLGEEWAVAGLVSLLATLGDRYPACEQDLTPEIQFGLNVASHRYDFRAAAGVEAYRRRLNEAVARLFERVDFVVAATTPDVAFGAAGPLPTSVDGVDLIAEWGFERALMNNGALTACSNLVGNPAVSIPWGTLDGCPVGVQVLARHHEEAALLDLALAAERSHPWPLVAPGAPH